MHYQKPTLFTGVFIDIDGDKYAAQVMQVVSPRNRPLARLLKRKRSTESVSSDNSSTSSTSGSDVSIHAVGGDMTITYEESLERDDPLAYIYKVQILEEAQPRNEQETPSTSVARRESSRVKERGKEATNKHEEGDAKSKWAGSIMDVQCSTISQVSFILFKLISEGNLTFSGEIAWCSPSHYFVVSLESAWIVTRHWHLPGQ